jgi:3-hydroxyisobutyrate dehydrogenase-like beta-hydroxyacid dehydrogenase
MSSHVRDSKSLSEFQAYRAKEQAMRLSELRASNKQKGTIGIIGLGIMGGAFAKNLRAAGWRIVGFDLSGARCREAKRNGAKIVDSAAAVAREARDVITSLPNPKALDAVSKELARAKLKPRVVIEASTFTIEDKERAERMLRKAGHIMLDCTVSGTGAQAKVKDLVFYASGDSKTIKRLRPMFLDFGREVYDLGAFGNGSKMKYVANLLVAIHNVAAAEAMVLGMKAGLDPQVVYQLANAGAGKSRAFELRGPMMVKNDYTNVTATVATLNKDMHVIGDFAKKLGVLVPLFRATEPIYDKALHGGYAQHDIGSVCAVLERMARLKRGKSRRKTR